MFVSGPNGRQGWPHSSLLLELLEVWQSRQPVTGVAEFDP